MTAKQDSNMLHIIHDIRTISGQDGSRRTVIQSVFQPYSATISTSLTVARVGVALLISVATVIDLTAAIPEALNGMCEPPQTTPHSMSGIPAGDTGVNNTAKCGRVTPRWGCSGYF